MNRQTKQLLALAGVLAVGLGAYAALRVWNAGEEEREAAQADYVLQLSDVTALSFDSGDAPSPSPWRRRAGPGTGTASSR